MNPELHAETDPTKPTLYRFGGGGHRFYIAMKTGDNFSYFSAQEGWVNRCNTSCYFATPEEAKAAFKEQHEGTDTELLDARNKFYPKLSPAYLV